MHLSSKSRPTFRDYEIPTVPQNGFLYDNRRSNCDSWGTENTQYRQHNSQDRQRNAQDRQRNAQNKQHNAQDRCTSNGLGRQKVQDTIEKTNYGRETVQGTLNSNTWGRNDVQDERPKYNSWGRNVQNERPKYNSWGRNDVQDERPKYNSWERNDVQDERRKYNSWGRNDIQDKKLDSEENMTRSSNYISDDYRKENTQDRRCKSNNWQRGNVQYILNDNRNHVSDSWEKENVQDRRHNAQERIHTSYGSGRNEKKESNSMGRRNEPNMRLQFEDIPADPPNSFLYDYERDNTQDRNYNSNSWVKENVNVQDRKYDLNSSGRGNKVNDGKFNNFRRNNSENYGHQSNICGHINQTRGPRGQYSAHGNQRQFMSVDWKEQQRINDEQRILKSLKSDGNWKREWDRDKTDDPAVSGSHSDGVHHSKNRRFYNNQHRNEGGMKSRSERTLSSFIDSQKGSRTKEEYPNKQNCSPTYQHKSLHSENQTFFPKSNPNQTFSPKSILKKASAYGINEPIKESPDETNYSFINSSYERNNDLEIGSENKSMRQLSDIKGDSVKNSQLSEKEENYKSSLEVQNTEKLRHSYEEKNNSEEDISEFNRGEEVKGKKVESYHDEDEENVCDDDEGDSYEIEELNNFVPKNPMQNALVNIFKQVMPTKKEKALLVPSKLSEEERAAALERLKDPAYINSKKAFLHTIDSEEMERYRGGENCSPTYEHKSLDSEHYSSESNQIQTFFPTSTFKKASDFGINEPIKTSANETDYSFINYSFERNNYLGITSENKSMGQLSDVEDSVENVQNLQLSEKEENYKLSLKLQNKEKLCHSYEEKNNSEEDLSVFNREEEISEINKEEKVESYHDEDEENVRADDKGDSYEIEELNNFVPKNSMQNALVNIFKQAVLTKKEKALLVPPKLSEEERAAALEKVKDPEYCKYINSKAAILHPNDIKEMEIYMEGENYNKEED